jgi:hypothetical protein
LVEQAREVLAEVQAEMRAYYEGKPDAWQEAEPGERCLERLEVIEEALANLEELRATPRSR